MDPQRLQEVESAFAAVLAAPLEERERVLVAHCGSDADLMRDVRSLVAAADDQGAFDTLYQAFSAELDGSRADSASDLTGARVGRYRLVEEIGRGGMGAVYRAERADGAFEQVVAVKVLRHDIDSEALHQQLRTERQLLAHVDHPNIARLLDGGRVPDGRPFLVMEFVEGIALDDYCDRERLTIDQRIELFLTVCAAVQHVHGHLVVHQDLKPGNILVTNEGRPMLLDFGIARLNDLELAAVGSAPDASRFLTPEYASPEQVRGDPSTTATDIYQLGVLLCELMTGRRPFARRRPPGGAREATVARPPSALVSQEPDAGPDDALENIARSRASTPARIRQRLSGDLDAIVLRATQSEPNQRYASVGELIGDCRRFLDGLPVSARSGSRLYRLRKFTRRNRVGITAAAVVLLAIVGFSVNVAIQSARVARERDRAEEVSVMLMDLFSGADPLYGIDTLTLGDFVDRAARRVEADQSDPALHVDLLTVLGNVYYNLSRSADAERVWTRALEIDSDARGPSSPSSAELQVALSKLRVDQGRQSEADSLARTALESLHRSGQDETGAMGRALAQGGYVRQIQGGLDSAAVLYRRALPLLDTTSIEGLRASAVANLNLGFLEQGRGDPVAAGAHLREALRLRGRAFGPESPSNAAVWEALAVNFRSAGQLDSADVASARALGISERTLPSPNRVIASNLHMRARIRADLGQLREADSLFARSLAMSEELYGRGSPATAGVTNNYAVFLERSGDTARARALYGMALEAYRAGFGEEHAYTAIVEANYARVLAAAGETSEAVDAFRHALGVLNDSEFDPALAARPSSDFGSLLLGMGDDEEAERLLDSAAGLWLATRPDDDEDVLRARAMRGTALTRLGHFDEAEVVLTATLERYRAKHGSEHETFRETVTRLVELYEAWERPEEAAAMRQLTPGDATSGR